MFSSTLVRFFRIATGLAFAVLIYAVLVQVLGRNVFNDSPVWTEELTRFALLYLAACGVGLSLRTGDLVNVDILINYFPTKIRRAFLIFASVATAALCATLMIPAWRFTAIGKWQTSPALSWRMDFIHASTIIFLGSILLFALLKIFEGIRDFNGPEDQIGEESE
ncbi:TRAP transporter small permease [Pseudovibrio sp. Tun.PSC04-5.I4]|uniref:TRAP transporter small permease n=1 Tax=Pseudovibrio sp. Tun.PSC04-5.I4 TaxID=1798213 RepID=UPI0008819F05|nr:TRAP transporter small permease [Pseudovibrio sp. Tun.PSC04-5.I4]SDQ21647.1 TRAP-type C4-dicarboxylate transport system, small permease component [Pseudovibrio sp. Tun.PSC04-5.I4]